MVPIPFKKKKKQKLELNDYRAKRNRPTKPKSPMRREEKRRKFNEAVVNTLFPPPSPPSPPPRHEDIPFNVSRQDFELESGSSANSGDEDGETQKLTRAQRKRMRKKKLKEDTSRRKQIIGPLLPSTTDEGENCTPCGRRNASEEPSDELPQPDCSNQKNKVKQRRKAKKLAREREQQH